MRVSCAGLEVLYGGHIGVKELRVESSPIGGRRCGKRCTNISRHCLSGGVSMAAVLESTEAWPTSLTGKWGAGREPAACRGVHSDEGLLGPRGDRLGALGRLLPQDPPHLAAGLGGGSGGESPAAAGSPSLLGEVRVRLDHDGPDLFPGTC